MANFGFSLGDIILVSNIAYTVYKSSKHAGKDFKVITADVKSLRSHLRALDDEFANPKSLVHRAGADQKEELETLLTYCRDDLKDLKDLLFKYRSLKSKSPRARDRIAFTTNKQSNIRARIATHSERLQRFLNNLHTGCLGRIENQAEIQAMCFEEIKIKLDALHEDVLAGKKGPSVITDMEGWIKQELVDDDITVTDVEVNQEQISAWLERLRLQDDMGAVLKDIVKREGAADASESSSPSMAGDARECQDQNLPEHIEGESLSPRRKTYEDSESSNAVYHAQQESDVQEQGISENFDFDLDMTGILISYHSNIETYVPDGHFRHVHTDSTCLGCPWNVPAMEKLLYQGEESILHFILAYKFMAATISKKNISQIHVALLVTWNDFLERVTKRVRIKHRTVFTDINSPIVESFIERTVNTDTTFSFILGGPAHLCLDFVQTTYPHLKPFLSEENTNLHYKAQITMAEVFQGWERRIETSNNVTLELFCKGPTDPLHKINVLSFGLPYSDQSNRHGYLELSVKIDWPESLTSAQREDLLKLLRKTDTEKGRFKVEVVNPEALNGRPFVVEFSYSDE